MMIEKVKFIKILPFLIVLVVSCIFLFTKLFDLDSVRANVLIETQDTKNNFEIIPFFWTVGIVGGCIGLTLVYVSWRKYKAEEKKELEKSNRKKSHL